MLDLLLRVLAFLAGSALVVYTVVGAIRAFVLPRNDVININRWTYLSIRRVFTWLTSLFNTFAQRDRIMAMYAPMSLVALDIVWLLLVAAGYTGVYWACGEGTWWQCFKISNSSLLTLGSEKSVTVAGTIASYSEATLGLLLITLLISYLPTIYQAYSRRELVVARLERRAGTPVSAPGLLTWLHHTQSLQDDGPQWEAWEGWFMELEETHTSLPILAFFRSPQSGRSWVTAMGTILDAAALRISTIDQPRDARVELCFKAGCLALNRISRYFKERAQSEPIATNAEESDSMQNPSRADFLTAYQMLVQSEVPLIADQEAAWKKYHVLRSRYTHAVEYIAKLTMAPAIKPLMPQSEDLLEIK